MKIMQAVIETPDFLKDAKAAGISEAERTNIVEAIAGNPLVGVEIPGSGGARKVRFAGRGKGKSGGYRVITFYGGADIPVFLLNVFAKGDRVNLSQEDVNELRVILAAIAARYREGVKRHVKGR
jgi:hypothetical protein